MNKAATIMLISALALPFSALAGPGGPGGHGGGHGPDMHGPMPGHRVSILPDLATAVMIGGLTYWLVNGTYYQKQGPEYVVVERPAAAPDSTLQVLDFNGKRYYVKEGHYYSRDIEGNYTEVPRPAGL